MPGVVQSRNFGVALREIGIFLDNFFEDIDRLVEAVGSPDLDEISAVDPSLERSFCVGKLTVQFSEPVGRYRHIDRTGYSLGNQEVILPPVVKEKLNVFGP